MLDVQNVSVSFGRHTVIHEASFRASPGDRVAVVGPNGSGKTTLLSAIATARSFEGRVDVHLPSGTKVENANIRGLVGYVPAAPSFPRRLSVLEVLRYYGWLRKMPPHVTEQRASRMLEATRLEDQASKRASNLSTGMSKRLALAIALMDDPPVVVLDELTNGIDEAHRALMLDLFKPQTILLMATHNKADIFSSCTHILALRAGRLSDLHRLAEDPSAREGQIDQLFASL